MAMLTDEDRDEFRLWVRDGLQRLAPLADTRRLAESGQRADPDLVKSLAELGIFGFAVPEHYGGADVGASGLAAFLIEAGRCLLPVPYLSSTVLAPAAIRWAQAETQFAELLTGIAEGAARVALAVGPFDDAPPQVKREGDVWRLTGVEPVVLEADTADWFIVAAHTDAGVGLFVVDRADAGVEVTNLDSLDVTRPVASVSWRQALAVPLGPAGNPVTAGPVLTQLQDLTRLAVAADAVGGAQHLLDISVDYAKTRIQFGRPIGAFQANKHRCADLFVAVQAATAAVEAAFEGLDQSDSSVPAPVPAAVAAIAALETYWQAVRTAMQMHGGLALTWEHEIQLYVKRATALQHLLGNPDQEFARLTDLVLAADYDVVQGLIG